MLWVEVASDIILRSWIVACAIPFKERRKRFFAGVFDGELDGIVNFVARTDALKWLSCVWIDEAVENFAKRLVVV